MMETIDLEGILEKYYQKAYDSTKRGDVFPMHWGEVSYLKEAVKEYAKQVLDLAAEEAITKTNDVNTSIIVDKNSILKIKERL